MTRSVPLMTKVPLSVMSGSSPRYTSCSRTSLTGFLAPGASLSSTIRRTFTRSEAAQLALFHVEHRLAEPVAHVLERGVSAVAGDREHALESRVQADLVALLLGLVDLEELAIRIQLDGEQVRRVEDARLLAKVLADALLLGKGISHRVVTSGSAHQTIKTAPPPSTRRCAAQWTVRGSEAGKGAT